MESVDRPGKYRRTTLSAFYNTCKRANDCIRCGALVDGVNEDWSTIGQAEARDRIVGGVLCQGCALAFIDWMKEGGLRYDRTTRDD